MFNSFLIVLNTCDAVSEPVSGRAQKATRNLTESVHGNDRFAVVFKLSKIIEKYSQAIKNDEDYLKLFKCINSVS